MTCCSIEGASPRDSPCIHLLGCDDELPQHILGIDGNGRDFFSRMLFGARISLIAGFAAVSFAVVARHAHRPGRRLLRGPGRQRHDAAHGRAAGVSCAAASDHRRHRAGAGLINAILAISVVTIPAYARVVRSSVLSVREQDFVAADRALGVGNFRLLLNRILPNSLTPLVVQATLGVATAVLEIAALCRSSASACSRPRRSGARCSPRSATTCSPLRTWSSSPVSPSCGTCSPSTCSATACVMRSTRG